MGIFKKLKGDDVRVNPIRVLFGSDDSHDVHPGENKNPTTGKVDRADFDYDTKGVNNAPLVYNSIRQLFYGAFITQNFTHTGSAFISKVQVDIEGVTNKEQSTFSRFDPSFQGSLAYQRDIPLNYNGDISVASISTKKFGESLVPGTVVVDGFTDDLSGNIYDGSTLIGNVFYDQGIVVRTDGTAIGTLTYSGSYTIYQSQYKCTAGPDEFNLSMNPSLLDSSLTDYNLDIVDSAEFMPFVTTIGLYNDNQDLVAVAKLSNPVQLNPYCDTNFIVRIDL